MKARANGEHVVPVRGGAAGDQLTATIADGVHSLRLTVGSATVNIPTTGLIINAAAAKGAFGTLVVVDTVGSISATKPVVTLFRYPSLTMPPVVSNFDGACPSSIEVGVDPLSGNALALISRADGNFANGLRDGCAKLTMTSTWGSPSTVEGARCSIASLDGTPVTSPCFLTAGVMKNGAADFSAATPVCTGETAGCSVLGDAPVCHCQPGSCADGKSCVPGDAGGIPICQ